VRMGLHTGTPLLTDEGTSVPTCIARRASLQRATAGRCSFRPRPRCWFERATVCPSSISGYTVSKTSRPRSGSPSSAGTSSCR
jgi:hypothetical protein